MDNRIDAIYGRQSIDKKDSISIESQFEFCRYEIKGGEAKEYKDGPVKIGLNQQHPTARGALV